MPSSVNLGEQLEAFVAEAVKTGRYGSRSEVLREGVRLVQEREAQLEKIKKAVARGIADAEAGRVVDAEIVFERLIRKYEAMAAKSAA
jgi:antitoxin ParD1/3/4